MKRFLHFFRTFQNNKRFVFEQPGESFAQHEQTASKETKEAVDTIKADLASMDVEEAVRVARAKIDAAEQKHVGWYVQNKELYSEAGNQYQLRVHEMASKARQRIRNNMDDYRFTKWAIEDVTKAQAEVQGKQAEYNTITSKIEGAAVFTDIKTEEDIDTATESLNDLILLREDAERMYLDLAKSKLQLSYMSRFLPKNLHGDIEKSVKNIEAQVNVLKAGVPKVIDAYNTGLEKLQKELPGRVDLNEEKVTKLREKSGGLQEKARKNPGTVKNEDLDEAFSKYTTQKKFVRDLKFFGEYLGYYTPIESTKEKHS